MPIVAPVALGVTCLAAAGAVCSVSNCLFKYWRYLITGPVVVDYSGATRKNVASRTSVAIVLNGEICLVSLRQDFRYWFCPD
jgi:hypothetical protein